ncbi:MAG: hypothetical protein WD871_06115 [Xanthobacteraceae bacterium]
MAALIIAVGKIDRQKIPAGIGILALLGCIFAGLAGNLFFVARLSWYDAPSYNRLRAFAVTSDGREVAVPSNFFGPLSISVAQMRIPTGLPSGFPTGTWASTARYSILSAGRECALPLNVNVRSTASRASLERLTRTWHAAVLRELDGNGRIAYDYYPHRIWSDPRRFDAFRELDKREIAAYRWVRDAICIDIDRRYGTTRLVDHAEILVRVDGGAR